MLYDRVEQTTTTTGTGTLSLVAPSDASRRSFVQAAGSGNPVYYVIETTDGTAYEYGYGTVTAGTPDTLTRNVYMSSNSNSLVNFPSGTKRVYCTIPAIRMGITTRSLTASGYQMLPGGLMIQWGITNDSGSTSDSTVTFPVAFPTAALIVAAVPIVNDVTTLLHSRHVHTMTSTGFRIQKRYVSNGGTVGAAAQDSFWHAVGY